MSINFKGGGKYSNPYIQRFIYIYRTFILLIVKKGENFFTKPSLNNFLIPYCLSSFALDTRITLSCCSLIICIFDIDMVCHFDDNVDLWEPGEGEADVAVPPC